MRRWQLPAFGVDNLTLTDAEVPEPGPGEVRVAIRAVSLNYRDHLMVQGAYDPRVPLPLVPCSDAAGVVEAAGEGVQTPIGERVAIAFAPCWKDGPQTVRALRCALGGPAPGVLASQIVVPADAVVRVPDHLSFEEASTLPCAGVTAYNALQACGIGRGDKLVTLGTGGVSVWALQLAVARGARVLVTSSSAEKAERARRLGAEATLDYQADPRWGRAAHDHFDGADGVVEVGGVGTLSQSLRACRAGGTLALIGVLAGNEAPVSLTRALMYGMRIQGIMVGSVADLRALCAEVEAGMIRPVIDRVFPFENTPEAFAHLASGRHFGKVILAGDA